MTGPRRFTRKTGYVRWKSALHFFSIYCIKAGYLLKKGGVWYLAPNGESKLQLGDIGLLESASAEYRKWREENPPAAPNGAEDLTEEGPAAMNYQDNLERSEMEAEAVDDTEIEGDDPEGEDDADITEESDIEAPVDSTEYEDAGITKPFNPPLINILTKQMSMDTLIKRMREGQVNLSPDSQRSEVWKPTARSRLVESLLIRNLPTSTVRSARNSELCYNDQNGASRKSVCSSSGPYSRRSYPDRG